jgi:beta-1,4-mannooligosaccharide/beta-1,4-mannosyl-N-acetylglucosamine phosphorylase
MLSRPSDPGHTPFGDIYYSESPDLTYWGRHRYVMGTKPGGWESVKIGAGPVPIETSEGWLLIYHGVQMSCSAFTYSMGIVLLDLDQPWKIVRRCSRYIMSPQVIYENVGDTPNVCFPCASLCDADTGRLAIYYGGADTVTCLAFGYVQDLLDFAKENDEG